MKRNNNIFKEDDMLVSEWNCKSTDYTSQNIEEFSSTVEFMLFMNKLVKAFINSLSDHLSSGYQL
jgi:hypothetical protein